MKPIVEHESVLVTEASTDAAIRSRRVTLALVGALLVLMLLLVMAASGVKLPDAQTTAKNTAATGLGILVTLAGLVFGGAALLRGRIFLAAMGLVVFLGGVSVLATTLGLPERFQTIADGITQIFDLINNILALVNRFLDWILR